MTNHPSQTTRQLRPASTSDVLPPAQRYAPACRAETPSASESRITAPSQNHGTRDTEQLSPLAPSDSPSINPTVHLSNNPSHSRASKPKARNGKIARLPHSIRNMVNRMLRNNIPHPKIVGALDEHGITVTQRNVSNWKTRGGYREWCAQQDSALETRLLQDNLVEHLRTTDASQLSEVGLQLAATQLSQFFLKPDVREQLTANPEKFSPAINVLCKLNRQLHRLQKYRDDSARELGYKHNPELVKREIEHGLEITRNVYSAAKLGQSINEPNIPHRNFIPKNQFADEAEQEPAPLPVDPLRALSDLASLLKTTHANKP